jgi:hypothetical protein
MNYFQLTLFIIVAIPPAIAQHIPIKMDGKTSIMEVHIILAHLHSRLLFCGSMKLSHVRATMQLSPLQVELTKVIFYLFMGKD